MIVRYLAKACAALGLGALATPAAAAVDWCRAIGFFPSVETSFEQSAAGIDSLGCKARSSDSAHLKMWSCDDQKPGDTSVYLERETAGYDRRTVLTFETGYSDLDHIRRCPGVESAGERFDGESIAFADQVVRRFGGYGLRRHRIALFKLLGPSIIAGGFSDGDPVWKYAEESFFGYRRPTTALSSVEIAGKRLLGTPLDDILDALKERGAAIRKDERGEEGLFRSVTLAPPTGLDGVSEVFVQALRQHVWKAVYTVPTLTAYQALVAALDSKYGASERRSSSNKGCTVREWAHGGYNAVEVVGEYCPHGSHLWFTNRIVDGQLQAHRDFLKQIIEAPKRKQPQIDRDNI
jgi:hypothetical protein